MRVALIGQAAFGEAVFNALRDAGEDIVAVSSIKGTEERPDPLWKAANAAGIPTFPTARLKKPDVLEAYAATAPDLGVMAFVTHILPERVLELPQRGTIQYHPSLLPRHRGINAMHWAIRQGEPATGLTIFWVDKGIDTGPILLQRDVPIGRDDTVGSLYFDKLFNMGVAALVESVRLVREGTAPKIRQDEAHATYEPPADDANSAIDWSRPANDVYNLIRGSNPTPGAHARHNTTLLRLFDARLIAPATTGNSELSTPNSPLDPGTITKITDDAIHIALTDRATLAVTRLQPDGEKKIAAPQWAATNNITPGTQLQNGHPG